MARLPRLAVAGLPHLVLLQGQAGLPIALDAADRHALHAALHEAAAASAVAVHAYAIAAGRVVLLATPGTGEALGALVQRVGRRYTAAFNRRHGRRGPLWDGRFRAAPLDAGTLLVAAMRHVEAPAAAEPDAMLSSVAHHRGQRPDPLVTDHPAFWALGNTPFEREAVWNTLVEQPLDAATAKTLDHAMAHGWAAGPPAFLAALADQVGRPLRPRRPGRPRRTVQPAAMAEPRNN